MFFLRFHDTTLDVSQTKLVVEALKDRIEVLWIGLDASLDFDTLQHYDGLGKCHEINVWNTYKKYKSMLETYGKKIGWRAHDDGTISRP